MKISKNKQNKNEQLQITIDKDPSDRTDLEYILEAAKEKANKEIEDASMGEFQHKAHILNLITEFEKKLEE